MIKKIAIDFCKFFAMIACVPLGIMLTALFGMLMVSLFGKGFGIAVTLMSVCSLAFIAVKYVDGDYD